MTYLYDQVRLWGDSNGHLLLVCVVRYSVDHIPSIGWKLETERETELLSLRYLQKGCPKLNVNDDKHQCSVVMMQDFKASMQY